MKIKRFTCAPVRKMAQEIGVTGRFDKTIVSARKKKNCRWCGRKKYRCKPMKLVHDIVEHEQQGKGHQPKEKPGKKGACRKLSRQLSRGFNRSGPQIHEAEILRRNQSRISQFMNDELDRGKILDHPTPRHSRMRTRKMKGRRKKPVTTGQLTSSVAVILSS